MEGNLETCFSLFAQIGSLGQNRGPELKKLNPISQGPQTACSSASFLTPPLGGPGLTITEDGAGQAATGPSSQSCLQSSLRMSHLCPLNIQSAF